MPTYDYRCRCGRVTESRESVETEAIKCRCGSLAARVQVYAPLIDLDMGPREGAIRRRRQENRDYNEAAQLVDADYASRERNGDRVPKRNYWQDAKKQAIGKG